MARTSKPSTALDLSALTVESAEMPKRVRSNGPNPFTEHVAASWSEGSAKGVTIPSGPLSDKSGRPANVVKVENLIRSAAAEQGLGVSFVTEDAGNGQTRVIFRAKQRKQRKGKVAE